MRRITYIIPRFLLIFTTCYLGMYSALLIFHNKSENFKQAPMVTDEGMKAPTWVPPGFDFVRDIMARGEILFDAPNSISFNDTKKVTLRLGFEDVSTKPITLISKDQTDKIKRIVNVSNTMEAVLTGSNFHIINITPINQAVNNKTEWQWEVTPKNQGEHMLHLSLSAIVQRSGAKTHLTVETITKTINVSITSTQSIMLFLKTNWQWLWAAILLPIVGWAQNYTNYKEKNLYCEFCDLTANKSLKQDK